MTSPTSNAPKNPSALTRRSLPRAPLPPRRRGPPAPTRRCRRRPARRPAAPSRRPRPAARSRGSGARLHTTRSGPRLTTSQPCSASYATDTRSSRGSDSHGSARRSRSSARCQSSISACGARAGSDQSSVEAATVCSACGSGTSSAAQPCPANSRRRPARTASASSGSSCEVKYCHGVDAAHSSPMNSIGVNGEVSTSAAADLGPARADESRQPLADRPVADLVVGLQRSRGTASRAPVSRRPVRPSPAPRNDEQVPAWKNAPVSVCCTAANASTAKSA